MALISNNLSTFNVPGVYVQEATAGSYAAGLTDFSEVYMVGTATSASCPFNTPLLVRSLDDFINLVGSSPSIPFVRMYFLQRPGKGINFVRVSAKKTRSLTVNGAVAAADYTLTFDGVPLTYRAKLTDTPAAVLGELAKLINESLRGVASLRNGVLRYAATTVVASANLTLGTETAAAATPTVGDFQDSIEYSFTGDMPQGYICAPEFFARAGVTSADHALISSSLESLANDPRYYWVAVIDPLVSTATEAMPAIAINKAIAERNALASSKGHSWYFFPYAVDAEDVLIPPSVLAVAVEIRRNRNEGFYEPGAGTGYPLVGVKRFTQNIDDLYQDRLNPLGINCLRSIPNNGNLIWGSRTLSTDPLYRFTSTRKVFNVLSGTLRAAYKSIVFKSIDRKAGQLSRVTATATGVLEQLRLAGALYGASPSESYQVICDLTNNTPENLDAGILYIDVYAKPNAIAEVVALRLIRTALGTVFETTDQTENVDPQASPEGGRTGN